MPEGSSLSDFLLVLVCWVSKSVYPVSTGAAMSSNSTSSEAEAAAAAAQAAAMAALKAFNIEAFTLLGVALLITGLRCFIRIRSVGFKGLWADDYLAVLAAVSRMSVMSVYHRANAER